MRLSKHLSRLALFLLLPLSGLLTSSSALAQLPEPSIAEAQRLLKQGQPAQALSKVDAYLGGKPKDPQGRFVKGMILTELKRNGEAIQIFKKLTEDFPELPEPYNNLAVLYAQDKQYERARAALEAAIKTHPAYAVAHENLGDIYAKLASQAYGKALQIDAGNTNAQSKMAMIRDLAPPSAVAMANKPAGRPSGEPIRLAAAEPAKPAATIAVSPPPAPAAAVATPTPPPAKPAAPLKAPVAAPAPNTPAAPAVVATAPTKPAPPAASAPSPDDAVKALNAWAEAWSRKDVKAYLGAYAPDFQTPGGQSRKTWEAERSSRITKPGAISVGVEKVVVESSGGDKATLRFRQNYRSANLKSSTGKIVTFVRHNGRWLIQQERVNP